MHTREHTAQSFSLFVPVETRLSSLLFVLRLVVDWRSRAGWLERGANLNEFVLFRPCGCVQFSPDDSETLEYGRCSMTTGGENAGQFDEATAQRHCLDSIVGMEVDRWSYQICEVHLSDFLMIAFK